MPRPIVTGRPGQQRVVQPLPTNPSGVHQAGAGQPILQLQSRTDSMLAALIQPRRLFGSSA